MSKRTKKVKARVTVDMGGNPIWNTPRTAELTAAKDAEIERLNDSLAASRHAYGRDTKYWHDRAEKAEAELAKIHATLQAGLDRDVDNSTTYHLATIAVNGLAMRDQLRAELKRLKESTNNGK